MKIRMNPVWFYVGIIFAISGANAALAADHTEHVVTEQTSASVDLSVSSPIAPLLAKGVVVIPIKSNDVKIAPVYGEAAAQVVPRLGHVHVTLDGASWHWVHADDGPVVIQGLSSGRHQLTFELADAAHRILTSRKLEFVVP
ncbi:DUF6130 family protein [Undibacterium sp. Ji50W]|uniref:DUF6130 family protein n=1 Tax=Undibacterium sp. Ji50W TaxID=3413041 RepID=UPI003BF0237A